jgi:hypothetical protein
MGMSGEGEQESWSRRRSGEVGTSGGGDHRRPWWQQSEPVFWQGRPLLTLFLNMYRVETLGLKKRRKNKSIRNYSIKILRGS